MYEIIYMLYKGLVVLMIIGNQIDYSYFEFSCLFIRSFYF